MLCLYFFLSCHKAEMTDCPVSVMLGLVRDSDTNFISTLLSFLSVFHLIAIASIEYWFLALLKLDAWGWCTGMTQRDGTGREEGRGFRMGNTWIPVVDSCWYMAKPIQYCKVINLQKKKKNPYQISTTTNSKLVVSNYIMQRRQWHPTPVLLPGESHGRRSLVGCSPWGR